MEENLTKTCLHDRHVALGALMSPFGGFDMPIQYKGITEEHNAVRHEVGVFDVSHMGEVRVKGADACKFVNHIFVNDVTGAPDGQIFYGMMCNEKGGTVDDLLVYKVSDDEYFLVINASNIAKDVDWILKNSEGFDVEIIDQSPYYGEVAIQGPKAEETVEQVLNIPVKDIPFYNFKTIHIDGEDIIVSRTGYTGEKMALKYTEVKIIYFLFMVVVIKKKKVLEGGDLFFDGIVFLANFKSNKVIYLIILRQAKKRLIKNFVFMAYCYREPKPAILKTNSDFKGTYLKGIASERSVEFLRKNLLSGEVVDFSIPRIKLKLLFLIRWHHS